MILIRSLCRNHSRPRRRSLSRLTHRCPRCPTPHSLLALSLLPRSARGRPLGLPNTGPSRTREHRTSQRQSQHRLYTTAFAQIDTEPQGRRHSRGAEAPSRRHAIRSPSWQPNRTYLPAAATHICAPATY
eukprot:2663815-Pleurochrysis_carterae.AAC.2